MFGKSAFGTNTGGFGQQPQQNNSVFGQQPQQQQPSAFGGKDFTQRAVNVRN